MNGYEPYDTKAVEVRLRGYDTAWTYALYTTEKLGMNHENACFQSYYRMAITIKSN
jgi:hypothetical protein